MKSKEQILQRLQDAAQADVDSSSGRAFGYCYFAGDELDKLAKEAYTMYLSKNALDPRAFPSVGKLEREVVGRVGRWMNLPENGKATFTSGGTESIILAVKCAREQGGRERPNLVAPETVHGAFRKAAEYLGVEFRGAKVTQGEYRANAETLRPLVDENTVMLVASAPEYAHGVIDDIGSIGALAQERDLPLHVDACIGGVLLAGMERKGIAVPSFDFRVDGVTSMSVDLHKYAYCPKGASVLLLRNKAQFAGQLFVCADWPGYPIVNTTMQSSRSAGPIAAAWAVLQHLGDDGLSRLSAEVYETTKAIALAIGEIDGLKLLAAPATSLVAFTTTDGNPVDLFDSVTAKGWLVHLQPGIESDPPSLHLTVTPAHIATWRQFCADLADAVENPVKLPQATIDDIVGGIDAGEKQQKGVSQLYTAFMAMPVEAKAQFLKMALSK